MIWEEIGEAERIFDARDKEASREELSAIIAKEHIDRVDYLKLLSSDGMDILELMARRARDLTEKYFGKVVLLYAPLYLADYCTNGCVYCGYSAVNKPLSRKKLDLVEMEAEMIALKNAGFDSVLLLTGGDRVKSSVGYIAEAVHLGRKYFSEVILEIYALTTEEYRMVQAAGASGLTLYQETYDRDLYDTGPSLRGEERLPFSSRGTGTRHCRGTQAYQHRSSSGSGFCRSGYVSGRRPW